MAGMTGQWTEITPATEETQKICDMVKSDAETKWTKQSYEIFKAIEYRAQPVSGTNFLIKVHAGGSEYLHIYAYQSSPTRGEIKTLLKRVEKHKEGDPLEPIRPLN
ncbi:cystatin-A5-like [Poecilia reticulata]|uniref:cystatin-A5-like n=1 Tax=Poecilia reticulata TaxID=8081 RepID=UPI0004A384E2|nr:PREDICTED: cystatin-A5-like [Poecilia reticulata]